MSDSSYYDDDICDVTSIEILSALLILLGILSGSTFLILFGCATFAANFMSRSKWKSSLLELLMNGVVEELSDSFLL
jgi:hypothetical protein